jgi:hypothetical protein
MWLGEEVMENSSFQGQMLGEQVTEEVFGDYAMWKGVMRDFSGVMGSRRGDEKVLTWIGMKVQWWFSDKDVWVGDLGGKQVKPGFA